ncbi:META domain-containing protein [Streptomyces boninensis]|uniref:META domain-containing protein n=1 Tax=Streptomyces boninensis TaxID=2039455 RepID=UPI003B216CB3
MTCAVLAAVGAVTLTLAGCGDEKADGGGSGAKDKGQVGAASEKPARPVAGTVWEVQSVTMSGKRLAAEPVRGKAATLEIKGSRANLRVCNGGSSAAKVGPEAVDFDGKWTSTMMACGGSADRLESTLHKVLKGKLSIAGDGNDLTLKSGKGDQVQLTAAR